MADDRPLSGWWGNVPESDDPAHPFRTADEERYHKGNLLGWGGMGTVHSAEDLRLRREVALKQGSDARLPQEAWICAQLEHPNIVPVYDAGHDSDGRPFYTMRLIRGRTLDAKIQSAPTLDDRLRLVRPFLAVCQAMAYAHTQGVVHRDLKPANIMVGEFGETQVVDWGVARPLDLTDNESASDQWIPESHRAHTMVGTVVGTPAYMSPEQATGERPHPCADVWSLGIILWEIIEGKPTFSGSDTEEILKQVIHSEIRTPGDGNPPELVAIVNRALCRDVAQRYPTAEQVAHDVEAWLDGKRVFAHDYTAMELLVRFVRAWKVPLAAFGITLVSIAVAAGITAIRVDRARQVAEDAVLLTHRALNVADDRLATMLAARSVSAFLLGMASEAEILAAKSLTRREFPNARGVLAGSLGQRLERLSAQEVSCPSASLSASGRLNHCNGPEFALFETATGELLWRADVMSRSAQVDEDSGHVIVEAPNKLVILDLQTGKVVRRHTLNGSAALGVSDNGVTTLTTSFEILIYDGHANQLITVEACRHSRVALAARGPERLLAMCSDNSWEMGPKNGPVKPIPRILDNPSTAVAWLDAQHIAFASSGGQIHIVNIDTRATVRVHSTAGGRVTKLAKRGEFLVANSEKGPPMLIRPHWRTRFPAGVRQVRFANGELITLGREGVERWALPSPILQEAWVAGGITAVDSSPDGRLLGIADGSGAGTIWTSKGQRVATLRPQDLVTKAVSFSRDGAHFAIAGMGDQLIHLYETSTWTKTGVSDGHGPFRRIAPIGSSDFLSLNYARQSIVVDPTGKTLEVLDSGTSFDLGASSRAVAVLTTDGVYVYDTALHKAFDYQDPVAVDLADDGRIVVAGEYNISIRDPSGLSLVEMTSEDRIRDVAWSPDGRWVVTGTISGNAEIFSAEDGILRAILPGHTQRIASLAFTPDGAYLYTGSWDQTARRWSMAALDADPAEWQAAAEKSWNRIAEDAISARF